MRFQDPPLKTPLVGNECIAGTDPTTDLDFHTTPQGLTQYAQDHLELADGTGNGLVTAAERAKLDALYTYDEDRSIIDQLGEIAIPVFIGAPSDGTVKIYRHVLTTPVEFDFMWFDVDSGSTQLTVTREGAVVSGWENIDITGKSGASATAGQMLNQGDVLALAFQSSVSPVNLYVTMRGNRNIGPV